MSDSALCVGGTDRMARDLVIRVAGEAGEGVQSTGILLAQATARAGFHVITFWTVPAEIKGGHALFQVRVGDHPLYAQGDQIDILLAFNQEAYELNTPQLRDGGLLLYDSAEFTPPETGQWRQLPVPLTDIAKNELKFELGKNVVAVGVCAALFGLPTHFAEKLLRDRWQRKGEEIVQLNMRALQAGIDYVQRNVPNRDEYTIEAPPVRPNTIVLSGSQSLSLGALAAGANFFAGYPITPASVEDSFQQAVNAFNLAEKYQCPVILMSDTVLMMRMEAVPKPELEKVTV